MEPGFEPRQSGFIILNYSVIPLLIKIVSLKAKKPYISTVL